MGRKSERSKTKKEEKSPKHTPSRSGRGRRRKKSQSDSDEEQQPHQSESRSTRKSRRGQSVSTPSQVESTSQPDWKEDESFWQTSAPPPENKEGSEDTVWKVQTSNGSGGEIQKLRICRQRPVGGSASDSAESSMSPHKDTTQSPKHTRSLRRENQKSPLVDSADADHSEAVEEAVHTSEASEFTLPLVGQPVVEYVYETQPNFMSIREASPIRLPVSPPRGVSLDQVMSQEDLDEPVLEITTETLDDDRLDQSPQQAEEKHVDSKPSDKKSKTDKAKVTTADDAGEASQAQLQPANEKSIESEPVKKESSSKADSRRFSVDKESTDKRRSSVEESDKRRVSADEQQKDKSKENVDVKEMRRISFDSEPKEKRRGSTEEKRRISVESGEAEKRRISVDSEPKDKRRGSAEEKDKRKESADEKDKRRISVDSEPKDKRRGSAEEKDKHRASADEKDKRRISVDSEPKEKRRGSAEEKEKRRMSGETKESENRRISVESEPIEKHRGSADDNESGDKRRTSVDVKETCDKESVEVEKQVELKEPAHQDSGEAQGQTLDTTNVEGGEVVVENCGGEGDTTKEEGEIVDDSPASVKMRRLIKFNSTASVESKPARITINRRSTPAEPPATPSPQGTTGGATTGSSQQTTTVATTAKKHPLITGPEPDEAPVSRRRKLSASLTSSTRTLITPTGTTRQVRSIPGQALKAVLQPEPDVKKEKRIKLVKTQSEESETKPSKGSVSRGRLSESKASTESRHREDLDKPSRGSVSSGRLSEGKASTEGRHRGEGKENKLDEVEDVREIIKNNRDKKLSETITTSSSNRKVHIGSLDETVSAQKPVRSSSPGDSKATSVLFICNLVRPFTAGQLKELLSRTGTIADNGFFIDRIKSKAFVKYIDVEMAIETRHALNGVKWPMSNPKSLKVTYASEKDLKQVQDSAEGEVVEHLHARTTGSWLSSEQPLTEPREKRKIGGNLREWDRGKDMEVMVVERLDKAERLEERLRDRRDKERVDKERERRKRRSSMERIPHHSPPPARKFKKKDYDAPAKLLDDLFRKTKTTPCLYWLPLSNEQIAVKEEARRKHMAEAERRISELKKSAEMRRERERERRRK